MLVWGVKVRPSGWLIVEVSEVLLNYKSPSNILGYISCKQLHVQLVSCDWQEVTLSMRGEWRSAWKTHGALCAMISGEELMLKLYVDSWGILLKVRVFFFLECSLGWGRNCFLVER